MTAQPQTLAPPHKRLLGFNVKHLARVLAKLQKMKGQPGFDVFRNAETNTKDGLVNYLLRNYTPADIDEAHEAARRDYPAGNGRPRQPRPGNAAPMPGLPSPSELQSLSQPSGSGSGANQPNQPQQQQQQPTGQFQPPTFQPPAHPTDPMAALAAALWPHLINPVAAVAGTGDNALMQVLAGALKQIAANAANQPQQTASGQAFVPPTVVQLQTPAMPQLQNLGVTHRQFPTLLKMANARMRSGHRLNIWVHGPAGTGKTTAAEKVAEVLGLPFHYNGALTTSFQVLGYMNANGKYVDTAFRRAWEHGGVYLFDEIDASMPDALLALNGALANSICPFPDKQIPRHKDCIVLAGANTTGMGGTVEYVGRYKQDAALTDRFVFLDWPLDEALEAALCANEYWTKRVRAVRQRAIANGLKSHPITPRATLYGEALLAAGISTDDVVSSVLRKGLPADQWATIATVGA